MSLGDSGEARGTPDVMVTPVGMTPDEPDGNPVIMAEEEETGLLRSSQDLWSPIRELGSAEPGRNYKDLE